MMHNEHLVRDYISLSLIMLIVLGKAVNRLSKRHPVTLEK
jgi:hypothetical protein